MRNFSCLWLSLLLAGVACGTTGPVEGNPEPEWQVEPLFLGLDEFYPAYQAGLDLVIADARPAVDYAKDHIIGARNIPFTAINNCDGAMVTETGGCFDLPMDKWIVAYCACPHSESEYLALGLIANGYSKVKVLDEGYIAWLERGYPVWRAP